MVRAACAVVATVAVGVFCRPTLDASHDWGGGVDDAYLVSVPTDSTSPTVPTETSTTPGPLTPTPTGVVSPVTGRNPLDTTTTLRTLPELTVPSLPVSLPAPELTVPTPPLPTTPPTLPAPCPPCPQFDYTVLAATTVTNTGPTSVSGGVGLWPGTAVTGFPPGIAVVDLDALNAQLELTADYLEAFARVPIVIGSELGGQLLTPGTYTALAPLEITGTLVLDGPGTYTFQSPSTLVTASGSRVELVNGARACDVTWVVGSSATLGTNSEFSGTIMALASITVTTDVTVHGRALARTGAVTLDSDTFTGC